MANPEQRVPAARLSSLPVTPVLAPMLMMVWMLLGGAAGIRRQASGRHVASRPCRQRRGQLAHIALAVPAQRSYDDD